VAATENVWDYPRPPAVEASGEHVVVEHAGRTVADTRRALRVLETSHPPTYYLPVADVADGVLQPARSGRRSVCEFKGTASYWDLLVGDARVPEVAWSYPNPRPGFEALRDHVAFYPGRVDRCTVDGEIVAAQPGDFYGGWITARVRGPFKGGPGTMGW
jgi:uncharacterized protein (DUF427 family)